MEQDSTFYHVRALERGLALLQVIAGSREPVGLTQFRDATGIPKSSLVRLLSVLERSGFIARFNDQGPYRLGPTFLRLADAERQQLDVELLARPYLRRLADESKQTSNLGVLQGTTVLHLCIEEPKRPLRFRPSKGGLVDDAYCTGLGKILLAGLSDAELSSHLPAEPFSRHTSNSATTLSELLGRIELVRTQGFALDDEERDMGVRCLAIPVRIVPGPLAAMSLAGPAGEFGPDTRPRYLALLRNTGLAMEADYKLGAALSPLRSSTPVLSDVTAR